MSHWDTETAEWYAKKYGEYATNQLGIEALILEADTTVVDICCGTGSALRHASQQVTRGALIGIDPVPRMVQIAVEQTASHPLVDRFSYCEGGAESLPVEGGIADIVLAFDSYDYWQDQPRGLHEVLRVLQPGGRFVVVKDGGLPNATGVKKAFLGGLADAGFRVVEENNIKKNDISFTQWVCLFRG